MALPGNVMFGICGALSIPAVDVPSVDDKLDPFGTVLPGFGGLHGLRGGVPTTKALFINPGPDGLGVWGTSELMAWPELVRLLPLGGPGVLSITGSETNVAGVVDPEELFDEFEKVLGLNGIFRGLIGHPPPLVPVPELTDATGIAIELADPTPRLAGRAVFTFTHVLSKTCRIDLRIYLSTAKTSHSAKWE